MINHTSFLCSVHSGPRSTGTMEMLHSAMRHNAKHASSKRPRLNSQLTHGSPVTGEHTPALQEKQSIEFKENTPVATLADHQLVDVKSEAAVNTDTTRDGESNVCRINCAELINRMELSISHCASNINASSVSVNLDSEVMTKDSLSISSSLLNGNIVLSGSLPNGNSGPPSSLPNGNSVPPNLKITAKIEDSKRCVSSDPSSCEGHSAGFDAFMTGFIFACYINRQNQHPSDFTPRTLSMQEHVNKVYLMGKNFPFLIRKTPFSKLSKNHSDKIKLLRSNALEETS